MAGAHPLRVLSSAELRGGGDACVVTPWSAESLDRPSPAPWTPKVSQDCQVCRPSAETALSQKGLS